MNRTMVISFLMFMITTVGLAAEIAYESCGLEVSVNSPPTRAITLNQQATEVMLALGLEDSMVGTAYLDDTMPARWQKAYSRIPVIAEKYPAKEVVLMQEPDFLFAGFASAFAEKNLGLQADWVNNDVATYLVDASCGAYHDPTVPMTTTPITRDIRIIGDIFDVKDRANVLIGNIEADIDRIRKLSPGAGRSAFFFDSGTDPAFSAGCCGGPALLMRIVGLRSISDNVDGSWANVSWELAVHKDPDIIILIDANWSSAREKIAFMKHDPVISTLDAVANDRFVILPFSETLLGMQFTEGVKNAAQQLKALGN